MVIKIKSTVQEQGSGQERDNEADDVIDLGAPRLPRRTPQTVTRSQRVPRYARTYTPNPRLYPGPQKTKRVEAPRVRRHKPTYRRPVPNARLYRPAPPRPPPPPAWRSGWPPPAPASRKLDTASRAALRLSEQRLRPRRKGLTLPLAAELGGASPAPPASLRHAMDPPEPDEGSDGNDPSSAPSEFLAEFLSAIMQRQYPEALKYCRLILQYEPHNATARGFYPLLQHKVDAQRQPPAPTAHAAARRSDETRRACRSPSPATTRRDSGDAASATLAMRCDLQRHAQSRYETRGDESPVASLSSSGEARARSSSRRGSASDDSCASQSSLEMDSSPSLSLSRRTDSGSGSAAGWESMGTGSGSGSGAALTDDNGNAAPLRHTPSPRDSPLMEDVENDNDLTSHLKSESNASLRRLRAQFACSIK